MFTPEERERVRAALVKRAHEDPCITGAALTGSVVRGEEDRWSDVDLFLGVDDTTDIDKVVRDWTEAVYRDAGAIHHFDVRAPAGLYRVFLLASGLQVDVAFTPASSFGPGGPNFHPLFGDPVELDPPDLPRFEDLAGLAWLGVLHARTAIERDKRWEAAHWVAAVRDQTLALACLRLGLPTAYARGVDRLPPEVTAPLESSFASGIEEVELRRGLRAVTRCLVNEIRRHDSGLAERLESPLLEATG